MSAEHIKQLYANQEAVRNRIVVTIIQLSIKGKINWDFSRFESPIFDEVARAEYKGLRLVSYNSRDSGRYGFQITAEGEEEKRSVYYFSEKEAIRLRRSLEELALAGKHKEETQIEELTGAEIQALEEDTEKLGEIVQLFQAQN